MVKFTALFLEHDDTCRYADDNSEDKSQTRHNDHHTAFAQTALIGYNRDKQNQLMKYLLLHILFRSVGQPGLVDMIIN